MGFSAEDTEEWIALARLQELFESIIQETEADKFRFFLTPSNKDVFRYGIYPEYKAGRGPKPIHYQALRQYALDNLNAEVVSGLEADDLLGIAQTADKEETVICSIDKDLTQVGGYFYNFVKKEFSFVDDEEAMFFYYQQCLTGDSTDNIPGLFRIGPSRAQKYIGDIRDPYKLRDHCLKWWLEKGHTKEEFLLTAQLVYVLREEGKYVPDEIKELIDAV